MVSLGSPNCWQIEPVLGDSRVNPPDFERTTYARRGPRHAVLTACVQDLSLRAPVLRVLKGAC